MAMTSTSLASLSALLRDGENVITPYVRDADEEPALGALAASGPRAEGAPDEYTRPDRGHQGGLPAPLRAAEADRGADGDLRLLAGDYLYALGLEKLADRGDLAAVRELADLISLSAQVHAENGDGSTEADVLWLAAAVAVGAGATEEHERAKEALRRAEPGAADRLLRSATRSSPRGGHERCAGPGSRLDRLRRRRRLRPWLKRETTSRGRRRSFRAPILRATSRASP